MLNNKVPVCHLRDVLRPKHLVCLAVKAFCALWVIIGMWQIGHRFNRFNQFLTIS